MTTKADASTAAPLVPARLDHPRRCSSSLAVVVVLLAQWLRELPARAVLHD